MNKSLRSLISLSGQSIAYGVGFFGRQFVVYLTLPLITNLMTQEEYGIVSIVTSFYTVINTLTNVGLPSATFRFYNDSEKESHQQAILGTSQTLFFLLASLAALCISLFAKVISFSLLGQEKYSLVIQVVAILLVLETMNYYGNILLRLHVRPGATSIHSIVYIVSQMGLAIVFIKYLDFGVIGYWLGFLLGGVIGLILMIWFNRKWIVFKFSRQHARELLRYGLPLIPATFSINFLQLTDRFFIRSLQSVESVAVYAIGYRIGSLVNLVLAPFSIAWPNFAFSTMNEPDARKTYRDVFTYLILGSTFIVLVTYLFRSQLINLVSPSSYQNAAIVVPWIAISMILYRIYPIISLGPRIKKQTSPLAWIAIATIIINIILHNALIPRAGIMGAAAATLLSYLLLIFISYIVSRKYYHFPLDGRRIVILFFATVFTAAVGELFIPVSDNILVTVLTRSLILLLYPGILLLFRFIPLKEFIGPIFSGIKEKFPRNDK